jgi:hypothetical protein
VDFAIGILTPWTLAPAEGHELPAESGLRRDGPELVGFIHPGPLAKQEGRKLLRKARGACLGGLGGLGPGLYDQPDVEPGLIITWGGLPQGAGRSARGMGRICPVAEPDLRGAA